MFNATKDEYSTLISEQIKACIHCGMCLPACPTYQITGNEGHSPRGRIYIINDELQEGLKSKTKDAIEYLDNCLECAACETVCPSGVEYINIIEHARKELKLNSYRKGFFALMRKLSFIYILPSREILRISRAFLNFLTMFIPLDKFIKISPKFEHSYIKIKTNYYYRSDIELSNLRDEERTLTLPLGCVMDTLYNHVHWDTIKVLNQFGYHVYIPETKCCGALAYHSGEYKIGETQLKETVSQFSANFYPIVMNSAGCGAFVKNHGKEFNSNLKVIDLIEALKSAPYNPMKADFTKASLSTETRNTKIIATYHPACHLNHQQGLAYEYLDILKQIPQLELVPLYDADVCCGSAGFYNLIKTSMAEKIGELKAKHIKDTNAKIVLSANPGCISQIQAHLGKDYKVLHPVTLIRGHLNALATLAMSPAPTINK